MLELIPLDGYVTQEDGFLIELFSTCVRISPVKTEGHIAPYDLIAMADALCEAAMKLKGRKKGR